MKMFIKKSFDEARGLVDYYDFPTLTFQTLHKEKVEAAEFMSYFTIWLLHFGIVNH